MNKKEFARAGGRVRGEQLHKQAVERRYLLAMQAKTFKSAWQLYYTVGVLDNFGANNDNALKFLATQATNPLLATLITLDLMKSGTTMARIKLFSKRAVANYKN